MIREFWLPALIAIVWTAYNLYAAVAPWEIKAFVNIFGPSFFLASWATGQFFRVKKQEGVDRNLTSIESRVEALVSKLEKHAQDFLGYTTGADSFAYFTPMLPGADIVELGLTNKSSYPVFDVRAEVIDLDEAIDPDKGKFWTRHQFLLASLYPSRILLGAYRFDLTGRQRLHLNIFIQSRSQSGSQQLRIARMGGEIRIAIKTTVGDKVVERSIPVDYPGNDPNDPDAIFK